MVLVDALVKRFIVQFSRAPIGKIQVELRQQDVLFVRVSFRQEKADQLADGFGI